MVSASNRSPLFGATQQDGVELIDNGNSTKVEPIITALEGKYPSTTLRNPTTHITPIKFYCVILLASATFLAIGIGLGVFIGLEMCHADALSEADDQIAAPQPTLQPANMPTPIPAAIDPCGDTFKFPTLSNVFFVNKTQMEEDCLIVEVAPFMDFLLAALRLETISGNLLGLLGLCVIVQLGGIPSVMKGENFSPLGLGLWLIWMVFSVLQYITTLIAQLMGVLAAFSFVEQYQDELKIFQNGLGAGVGAGVGASVGTGVGLVSWVVLFDICKLKDRDDYSAQAPLIYIVFVGIIGLCLGAFYGSFTDATFFAAIIPSLIFHPTFVAKNAALCVYAFIILQGVTASKLVTVHIDKAMKLYALFMIAPMMTLGMLYLTFTASFVYSLFFYVPMSLCLAIVLLIIWHALAIAKKGSQESRNVVIQSVECDLDYMNPLKPLDGSLWWLPGTLTSIVADGNIAARNVMLKMVLLSALLVVLSPLLVFGHWAAFYSYLGGSSSNNMQYVTLTYKHFFGVFVDVEFYIPDLLNFNFNDISEWTSALKDVPSFGVLPPAAMLEGSAVFSALSLLLSFIKPLVCLLSFIFSTAGMVGKNTKVGKVAEVFGSYEGILKGLVGKECVEALKRKNKDWVCKLDTNCKNILELHVPDNTDFDIAALAKCKSLSVFSASGNKITG